MRARDVAFVAAGFLAFLAFVAVGAYTIASLGSGEAGPAPTNAPLLVASPDPTPAPALPEARTALIQAAPSPPAAPEAPRLGAPDPAPPAPPPRPGAEAIVRLPLEEPPRKRVRQPAPEPAPRASSRAPGEEEPRLPALERAPAPVVARPRPDPRYEGVLTPGEIRRMRAALRLTPEQEGYWPPVEGVLREIGAQQVSLIRAGRRPEEAFSAEGVSGRLFWAARPLIGSLREDQKEVIRRRARSLGLEAVASYI